MSALNSTNRASVTDVAADRTAPMAILAASWAGQPYAPAETAGKATVAAPSSSATRSDSM
jgi:hypothetical protein